MGSQTILLICLGFSAINIVNGIHTWEFGKDNIPEAIVTTRYRGYFTIFEKQQHIHLVVPPCHVVTYVKVQVRNLLATPKVLYNFDTNVVTIYYGFWDLSTSTFGIIAKSVLQQGCQVGPPVPQQQPKNPNGQPPHPVQVGPARPPVQPVQPPQRPPLQQRPPNGQATRPVQVGPAKPPVQPVQPPHGPPVQQRPPNGQPPHPVQVGPARPPFQPPQGPPAQQRPPNGQPPHPVQVDPTKPLFRPVQPPQGPPVYQRPPNGPHDPNTIPRLNAEEQSSKKDQDDLQNDQTIQTVEDPHEPNTIPRLNSEEQNSQKGLENQEDLQSVPDIEHNKVTDTEDGKSENHK